MLLAPFLRGQPPRPNPDAPPAWRLELREPDGGDWRLVQALDSEKAATEEATAPLVAPAYGALLRVVSPAGATAALWVQGAVDLWRAEAVPPSLNPERRPDLDWESAWEVDQPDVAAESMVLVAQYADRRRLVRVACDCVAEAVAEMPPEETAVRADLAAVRAWAWGPPGKPGADVRAAAQSRRSVPSRFAVASLAVQDAAAAALELGVAQYARRAASAVRQAGERYSDASNYRRTDSRVAQAAQPALVRRHLPLSVVLLSLFDERTPTDLGF